jgi:bifunctional DNase/RNase
VVFEHSNQIVKERGVIQVKVHGLSIDASNNSPIVVLKEQGGERTLPIWIGLLEATAIASELENISFSRPMTHDLFITLLRTLGCTLLKVEIVDIKDSIFYASLHVNDDSNRLLRLDARPSDAIALALRAQAPIYVAAHIFGIDKASVRGEGAGREKWRDLLERMSPEDFGKYKM